MKVRVKSRLVFRGKVYKEGEVISSPPLPKEDMEYLLKIVKQYPHLFEIIEKKKEVKKNVS